MLILAFVDNITARFCQRRANAELIQIHNLLASSKEKVVALESKHISLKASLSEAKSELSVVSGD